MCVLPFRSPPPAVCPLTSPVHHTSSNRPCRYRHTSTTTTTPATACSPRYHPEGQGMFLVGQPASQGAGKQGVASSTGHVVSSPTTVTQQAILVTTGQMAAILAQISTVWTQNGGKVPGSGGVLSGQICILLCSGSSQPGGSHQGCKERQCYHDKERHGNRHYHGKERHQFGNHDEGRSSKCHLGKGSQHPQHRYQHACYQHCQRCGVYGSGVPERGVPESASTTLISEMAAGREKTAATLSGMLKIHSGGFPLPALTVPDNQLKQIGVGTATDHSDARQQRPLTPPKTKEVVLWC
ncbi:uncharacterized protein ACWYII_010837 [Salvelinus alpinus]